MSIIYCEKHDIRWDSDFKEQCPQCESDPYISNGYEDRADYLKCLSEDYGAPLSTVNMLADMLGPNEDFDGLVIALEDHQSES